MNTLDQKQEKKKMEKKERNTTSGYNSSSNQGLSVIYIPFQNKIYIFPNVQYLFFLCDNAYAAVKMPQQSYQLSRSHVRVSLWKKNGTISASSCNL